MGLCPLEGSLSVVRTDPCPGFAALVGDEGLAKHRVAIEVGNAKNVNIIPVAERAVQEVQGEVLRGVCVVWLPQCCFPLPPLM